MEPTPFFLPTQEPYKNDAGKTRKNERFKAVVLTQIVAKNVGLTDFLS
jgi:hypothetical protein